MRPARGAAVSAFDDPPAPRVMRLPLPLLLSSNEEMDRRDRDPHYAAQVRQVARDHFVPALFWLCLAMGAVFSAELPA